MDNINFTNPSAIRNLALLTLTSAKRDKSNHKDHTTAVSGGEPAPMSE